MPLTFEEVLKSVFKKTIEDVLNEREQRIKTDDNKQDALESGVNIKTVNHESILGAGNIDVAGANVYTVQEGDITLIRREGPREFVEQLSPNMVAAVTEFKKRIDFPNMGQYELSDIKASYVAATPVAQFDNFLGEHNTCVVYVYLSNADLSLMWGYFLHYTVKDDVPVDEWHVIYDIPDYITPENLQFYTNNMNKVDHVYLNGITYEIGGDYVANTIVRTGDWSADDTYTEFPYKAEITIPQMQENSDAVFEVVFDVPEAVSGNYAPVCYYDGVHDALSIWAKEIPDHDITIPLIKQIL